MAVATEAIAETVEIVGVDPGVAVAEILTIVAAKIVVARVVLVAVKANAAMAAAADAHPVVADSMVPVLADPVLPADLALLVVRGIVRLVIVVHVQREIALREITPAETAPREIVRRGVMAPQAGIAAHGMIVGTAGIAAHVGTVDNEETAGIVGMMVRAKNVHGWIMDGSPGSSPNRGRWRHWRSRSKRPVVLTPYLMSRNYFCLHGIGIWSISFTKIRPRLPVAHSPRMHLRKWPRQSQLRHRNLCNAPWIARFG